jgi:PhnB protein
MSRLHAYLTFDGHCREAFDHYQTVLGGEVTYLSTFAEMPPQEGMPPLPEEVKTRIMHMTLQIDADTVLLGSDTGGEWGPALQPGNSVTLSYNAADAADGQRIFDALASGGSVTMPFGPVFWGGVFGQCADRFGVNWMVSAPGDE